MREHLAHPPAAPQSAPVAAAPAPANGAIYRAAGTPGGWSLFEDRRPCNVGDVLTILVRENSSASKSSAANATRDAKLAATLTAVPKALAGLVRDMDAGASGSNALNAKGGANASNTFNGVITVTVVEVRPNGNLVVSGEKQMLINQGTESIRFSGVVDPRMVGVNNTVLSTQVADARIEYSARGFIDEAETMGWLQRFFLNVLPL
jgi:flagellar L-ring protein precursor FlgH